MNRKILEKNTNLILKDKNGENHEYRIEYVIPRGLLGTSCVCYKAHRIEDGTMVLLKQFNPINDRIKQEKFEKAVEVIRKLSNCASTEEYICADHDIQVLYDEDTIYCENHYYTQLIDWKTFSEEKKIRVYEILQTAISVIRFLKELHKLGYAYVDLKPEDIILRIDEVGKVLITQPLFFDFNSVLELDKTYKMEEVRNLTTEKYRARVFTDYSVESVKINLATEQEMFANVLETLIKGKMQTISKNVKKRLKNLINELKKSSKSEWTDEQIEIELQNIKEDILKEEHAKDDKRLNSRMILFNIIRIFILGFTIIGHSVITVHLLRLCINREMLTSFAEVKREVILVLAATLVLMVMKLLYWILAERIANYIISAKSYRERTNVSEYETFRKGSRKNTTYQDQNECNLNRQRRRRVLWVILFISLVGCLVLSIVKHSFSILLSLGFPVLIIFMYSDFLPSVKEFYELFKASKNESRDINGKAFFYQEEYRRTGGTFDLNNVFYKENHRNLFELKKDVLEECFDISKLKNMSWWERLKCLFVYTYRYKMFEKYQVNTIDLKYEPLQIKHMYKMAFDRMRNRHLIIIISTTLLIGVMVGVDFAQYIDYIRTYFSFPENLYLGITIGLNGFIFLVNIYQIVFILQEELLVSNFAFKTRYMLDELLNDQLVIDIVAAIVKPIDLVRGTWQYDGFISTTSNFRQRRKLRMYELPYNRPLLHHSELSNRRRLSFTVWLLFGTIFSFLVLQLQFYFLTPILIIATSLIHYILRKYLLPIMGKKKLIEEIEKLNSFSGK